MAGYTFDVKLHQGKFDVQVDTAMCYGYFEHDELGDECGGGLWFDRVAIPEDPVGSQLVLIDCDGTSSLPKSVAKALRDAGFIVSEDFD